MIITHIHWSLATGGTETLLVDIVNEQVKCPNVQVNIIVFNNNVYEPILSKIDKRCRVYFVNREIGSKNPFPIFKLNYFLFKIHPDIIHIHGAGIIKYIFYPKAKKVRTIHSVLCEATEYKYFDELYCISDSVQEFTSSQGYPQSITVSNGIVCSKIRSKVANNNSLFRIVQVSRLVHNHKGQHILIEALNILINNKGLKGISLDLIGEGPSQSYLVDLVKKYKLENCIHFLGQKSREYIYSNLNVYDLFVQPSVSEGFGLTIAEAMIAKVPVIVSDIPAPMEVIGNGKYGYYFQTENSLDLANKIEAVIKHGYNSDIIESAYEHVKNNYDISLTANKYLEHYNYLLNE